MESSHQIENKFDNNRLKVVQTSEIIAVKVGTRVLAEPSGEINDRQIRALGNQICDMVDAGKKVVLISSGAVGCGVNELKLDRRPADVAKLQAIAAIGQAQLIEKYHDVFAARSKRAAQILLTAEDLDDRARYLNVRNTIFSVLDYGAIPIINENDTVAVDELVTKFGDNDQLAACITTLLPAGLLIILSDVEGLYDGDPEDPNSKLISAVDSIDADILKLAGATKSNGKIQLSRGGMKSKLNAARMATLAGENVIIASGRKPDVLTEIMTGKNVGTLFAANDKSVPSRKRWIGFSTQTHGSVKIDDGALIAIREKGRSLLPIGVVSVTGKFQKGDAITIVDSSDREVGRGLSNYSFEELIKIRGLKSDRITQVLERRGYEEVVHRDNLVIL